MMGLQLKSRASFCSVMVAIGKVVLLLWIELCLFAPVTAQFGMCSVHGDPHYTTFDKRHFNFQGGCVYTIAIVNKDGTKGVPQNSWKIIGNNQKVPHPGRPNQPKEKQPSIIADVGIFVHKKVVQIISSTINGTLSSSVNFDGNANPTLPINNSLIFVKKISQFGIEIKTDFGLIVEFDPDKSHRVIIKVPENLNLKSRMRGLCGNWNDDPNDDFMKPNGTTTTDIVEFARSWQEGTCQDN